jgi:O-antigen ligase
VGLDENGRIPLYKEAAELFLNRPFFGVGYDYPTQLIARDPVYPAHNTVLQFMASGGIVGLCVCLYLFGSRYFMFYDAWKPRHAFFLIMMLLYDVYGLFELAMFLPYAVFLTCVIFNALEQENGGAARRKLIERKKWIF